MTNLHDKLDNDARLSPGIIEKRAYEVKFAFSDFSGGHDKENIVCYSLAMSRLPVCVLSRGCRIRKNVIPLQIQMIAEWSSGSSLGS